jgi:hypothetical protein
VKTGFQLLLATLLISSFVWAQDSTPQMSNSNGGSSANSASTQGCLSGSSGNYMLTQDGTGTMYKFVGADDMLKKHVGHEVAVTGQTSSPGSAADSSQGQSGTATADSPSAGGANTIQVSDVKMISKRCNSGTDSSR